MKSILILCSIFVLASCSSSPSKNKISTDKETLDSSQQTKKKNSSNFAPPKKTEFSITDCKLELSARITTLITNYDPDFKVRKFEDYAESCVGPKYYTCTSNQTPFSVIGHFNGDSIPDIVLMGYTRKYDIILALVSDNQDYDIIQVDKSELSDPHKELCGGYGKGLWIYLNYVDKKKLKSPYEDKSLNLSNEAFEIVYCGKASELRYYKNGKFEIYTTSD